MLVLLRLAGSIVIAACGFFAPAALAEPATLHIELNAMQKSSTGCRLTFLMKNNLQPEITDLSFEVVLFDDQSRVKRIIALKSGSLPSGKTKVKQFDIANETCAKISRILINSIETCKGEGITARICLSKLNVSTRTTTKFGL